MGKTKHTRGGEWCAQGAYGVRFEWGPEGARRLMAGVADVDADSDADTDTDTDAGSALDTDAGCLVVVDVLSFSTAVSVAVDAGTQVFPYAWRDESAVAFAAGRGAELAVGRRAMSTASPWSLSPAALRRAPFTPRLVLPSPNGSAIAAAAGASGAVVAGCLRNAAAVGSWLVGQGYGVPGRPVAVVAAGERWTDGSLRPAVEDLLGAGAVISAMRGVGISPEAAVAAGAFVSCGDVASAVADCASGAELRGYGFAEDVAVAVEAGASQGVPVLKDGAFSSATGTFPSPTPPQPPNRPRTSPSGV
ncbi:2-phosphosulfolactate phosphatase [Streptomyces sp. NPDC046925]|uniref:2-phosphosulfolactate phosphatase n=1 Tax=Streptomyces sp. NPDC046925 TaxID=3155375 RepID=UPI0033FB3F77